MDPKLRKQMRALEKARHRRVPSALYTTEMKDPANVLEVEELQTCFFTEEGIVPAADGVSFCVPGGKTLCLVGESGCGKSVTSLSVMQLLTRPYGQITGGAIRLNMGTYALDIAKMPEQAMTALRGDQIGMIFQEPMTALNPVYTIGKQLTEVIALHDRSRPTAAAQKSRALELLRTVGIPDGARVFRTYPHALSGGMRQRVMIAMALACDPALIIADEPTTALDVTIQAQILALLRQLRDRLGTSILLITHDLGVVAEMADFVAVMYAGRIVEQGTVREIFKSPAHPYTRGLLASKPVVGKGKTALYSIPGMVPAPLELPPHCHFYYRCDRAGESCAAGYPTLLRLSATHSVRCYQEERQ